MVQDSLSALWNPSVFNELIAGSVGGAAQVLVGQPLDTVKTRAQIAPSEYLFLIGFDMFDWIV
jgi:solute carrier family 25 carnitine/acylcarnitine transporter 20/29